MEALQEYDDANLVTMYKAMADAQPVLLWASDTSGAYTHFNSTWLEFRGRSEELERGEGWLEGVHPDDREYCVSLYLDAFAQRQPFEMEYRLRRHDGVDRWVLDIGAPWSEPDGSFAGYIGVCVDVTEHRERLARIEQDRDELESTLAALPTAVVAIDSSGKVTAANDAALTLFDSPERPLVGTDAAAVVASTFDHDGRRRADRAIFESLPSGSQERWSGEIGITTDGQVRWFAVDNIPIAGVSGVADSAIVTFTDVTKHHLVEQMLTLESHQDPLTGLANRRAFLHRLDRMWSSPQDVAVAMIDVDRFKSINDRYGHSVGDEVLVEVAARLRASVRTEDLVVRLGGDEFALVCAADDPSEEILARVGDEFVSDIDTSAGPIAVRVSIGIARPETGDTPNDLLRGADQSMYRAKRAGKDAAG